MQTTGFLFAPELTVFSSAFTTRATKYILSLGSRSLVINKKSKRRNRVLEYLFVMRARGARRDGVYIVSEGGVLDWHLPRRVVNVSVLSFLPTDRRPDAPLVWSVFGLALSGVVLRRDHKQGAS
jgi:hypothetical protein